jgi:hypothetical protein
MTVPPGANLANSTSVVRRCHSASSRYVNMSEIPINAGQTGATDVAVNHHRAQAPRTVIPTSGANPARRS